MKRYAVILPLSFMFVLTLSACKKDYPASLGESWEVYVVADSSVWHNVGPIIKGALEKKIPTPLLEDEYVVIHVSPDSLKDYLPAKNLLLVSDLEPRSTMDDLLRQALSKKNYERLASGKEYLLVSRNQWTDDQFILILGAPGMAQLVADADYYPDFIYKLFNDNRNRRVEEQLFFGTHGYEERQLKDKYGWTIKIPYGYTVRQEDPDKQFVRIMQPEPECNIFVHWMPDNKNIKLDESWLRQQIKWMGQDFRNAYVQQGYDYAADREFAGYKALMMTGLWQSDTDFSGGPMKAYAFRVPEQNRIYVLYYNVYAPDRRNEPYLRELQLIIETFKAFGKESQTTKKGS